MLKFEAKLQQVLAATQKDLPSTSSVLIDGQNMKVTDIVTQLQSWIALYDKLAVAKQGVAPAQQAVTAAEPQARAFIVNFVKALKVALGAKNPLLADFGVAVTAPKSRSAQTNVIAAAKAKATREARGTVGKKKKLQVVAGGSPTLTVTSPTGEQLLQSEAPPVIGAAAVVAPASAATATVASTAAVPGK